jgi:hypothetical protein
MGRIQFIQHKGKQVLHLDLSNAKATDVVQLVRDATPLIAAQPEKSIRTLTDVTNMAYDSEGTEALIEFSKRNRPYVLAGAIVGVAGLRKVIYNAALMFSGRKLEAFDTLDEAKDWLVTQ